MPLVTFQRAFLKPDLDVSYAAEEERVPPCPLPGSAALGEGAHTAHLHADTHPQQASTRMSPALALDLNKPPSKAEPA